METILETGIGWWVFCLMVFCLVAWPLLTYVGDAVRYLVQRLKGGGGK